MPENAQIGRSAFDPALCQIELPLRRRYFPLGFPLDLQTNSPEVIQAANEAWGHFRQAFEEAPATISLGVTDSDSIPAEPQSKVRSRESFLFVVADPENFFLCDFERRLALGWVTNAVVKDHPFLRYRFLTPAANWLIQQLALAPIHGALLARNGCGVLLCGESFAGKTTLAYACARSGWTYITDDGTFVVRDRAERYAVGDPNIIRFREDVRRLFPELSDRLPSVRPNGKIAIELFTRDLPLSTAPGSPIHHVVFLNRQEKGTVRLCRYPTHQALDAWDVYTCFGTEKIRAAQRRTYERLLEPGAWELTYSHFGDAVTRLEQLVDCGG